MKNLLLILTAAVLFTGCYTDKKATDQVQKAINKKPQIAAALTRAAFPCIIKKTDTTISVTDTTIIMVDCPDTAYVTPTTDYFTLHDTMMKVITKTIKVPVKIPVVTRYIETFIEDSAQIKAIQYKNDVITKENIQLHSMLKDRNNLILWLLIVCAVLAAGNILQFKK